MATFMNKALTYLGLKDIDDDELYDDYDEEETHRPMRASHTIYPAQDEPAPERFTGNGAMIRPLPTEDSGRQAIVRPLVPRASNARVHVVAPSQFSEAQEIGDLIKASSPVIVNLQLSERDLQRRMIDFCSGLTYALGGAMEKVADQVFLLTPSNVDISPEERSRLAQRGLFSS